jgi:hypothetical protein
MHTEHCPVSALVVVEKFGERNCCLLDCLDERRPSSRAELAVSRRERTSGEATKSISEIAENSTPKTSDALSSKKAVVMSRNSRMLAADGMMPRCFRDTRASLSRPIETLMSEITRLRRLSEGGPILKKLCVPCYPRVAMLRCELKE